MGGSLRVLRCPHCTYTTSHKLSLNGHMNIHTNPDDSTSSAAKSAATFSPTMDPRASERYCTDCDIQFSSMKTFRVHKAHYCQTRHVLKGSKSPVREDVGTAAHSSLSGIGVPNVPTSGSTTSPVQPVLALPTNPVLLVPYSLLAGAQLLPPHVLPHLSAAFILPNGQVHPLTAAAPGSAATHVPPILSPGAIAAATAAAMAETVASASRSSSGLSTVDKNEINSQFSRITREEFKATLETPSSKRRVEAESPLDLTTKRVKLSVKSDLLNDEEKENRELNGSVSINSPIPKSVSAGEFEGKLLASPPGVSPGSDAGNRSIRKKSPEPSSSMDTSLASPQASSESPRPSTSAAATGNPGSSPRHSPVGSTTPSLPSLPPGFPNPLVSSLEALGSALPLASLQCLQSLQNVPRDLALKLINPDLLINGLSPVISPPVIVKQGEAKCNECNIVFYKEESLQIHKKHYCSARENKTPEDEPSPSLTGKRSPITSSSIEPSTTTRHSPARDLNTTSTSSSQKENSKSSKTLLQFICSACGIKFSSPDNLAAHQTYYCPKREGSAEDGVTKGLWKCPRCRVVMTETMQAAHQCVSPTPAPTHGWKCPCCPVLSPTAAAAQKHLETHAGIKAFRCTICGYRGNTLRGMRTHIRMHFEKRTSDLQEENFIACILADDEPRSRNNLSTESRKFLESSRMMLENSPLTAMLAEGALTDRVDPPLTCAYCPFITPLRSTLVQHLALVHKIGLNAKLSQDLKALLENRPQMEAGSTASIEAPKDAPENGKPDISSPPLSIKLEPEVKLEVQETDEQLPSHSPSLKLDLPTTSVTASLSNGGSSSKNCVCYCQACNISFSVLDSYVAHKRFYCNRPESNTPPETTVQ